LVRSTRGKRSPTDDDPTVLAPPEEPTLSAKLDVKAAFEALDPTLPGSDVDADVTAVDVRLPNDNEAPANRQEHTLPLVKTAELLPMQPPSQTPPLVATSAPLDDALPPSSARLDDTPSDPPSDPEVPASVAPAQRRKMQRIVFGVIGFCGLLCVGAGVRQLWPGAKHDDAPRAVAAATAAPATATATTATGTAPAPTAPPDIPPPEPPSANANANDSPPVPASATATATAPATAAAHALTAPTPPATAAPADPRPPVVAANAPPPTPPRRPDRAPTVHPRPPATQQQQSATVAKPPAGRTNIVRDAPF
jgi:hypothetical protein